MWIQAVPRRARPSGLRVLGFMVALVVATVLASAGHVQAAKASGPIELTYTKWVLPDYSMKGVVGGDIVGTFGGQVLGANPIAGGTILQLQARYDVIANNPSQSFTALVEGKQNNETGTAVLNGVVTSGWLAGERLHVEYSVISSCAGNPSGPCYQGTIDVMGNS
jgi:hypothetical protein